MYQALYRKWRPKTFSDVVGQEHVTETLQRQVAEGRLSHAYLFTGTRGTGKTTCAKILAKAVNCEHPENGNPCNKCQSCLGIESGGFLDVMELDAASNNGVDHVRALRDEAIYSPAQVKKRVYIIDEVHMLSIAAFNAAGGTVILAGWSDNYENYDVIQNNSHIKHMAATQNDVLAALGSHLRISDGAAHIQRRAQ